MVKNGESPGSKLSSKLVNTFKIPTANQIIFTLQYNANWKIWRDLNDEMSGVSIGYKAPDYIFFVCTRKNSKLLFSAELVLLEFWNYTFHPMRMTDAILSGHTSPGTIKAALTMLALSLPLLLAGSKVRPADTKENISLYILGRFQQQTRTFHLERAHFNICSSASFRRPFPC